MYEIGTKVMHKFPGKSEGGVMKARWDDGIWLGKTINSDEHIVATKDGSVVKARSVTRKLESESWNAEDVLAVTAVTWKVGKKDGEAAREVRILGPEDEAVHDMDNGGDDVRGPPDPVFREPVPRDVYVTPENLKDYGYTENCNKCRAMRVGSSRLNNRSHTKECRDRIRDCIKEKEPKKHKEKRERVDEHLSQEVEKKIEELEAAKKIRTEVNEHDTEHKDFDMEIEGSGGASSSSSGMKRTRDAGEDEEERNRATHYQALSAEKRGGICKNKYFCAEAFSPPRLCERARSRGLKGGWSLDIIAKDPITGEMWDLSCGSRQKKAIGMLRRDKPKLLVVSPPCTLFSILQNLSGKPEDRVPGEWKKAIELLNFAVELCLEQHRLGGVFIFEHPKSATSWKLPSLRKLREKEGILEATCHMCSFGMESCDQEGLAPVKKPTRFLTNRECVKEKLDRRCAGGHRHVHLVEGRAKKAAIYPQELLDAMLDAIDIEDKVMGCIKGKAQELLAMEKLHEADFEDWSYIDDNTGEVLDKKLVGKARAEELKGFEKMKVYKYVERSVAMQDKNGKLVKVRWVDVMKTDGVRSRLVAQEFASGEVREDLFAGTPPLAATRYIVSSVASCGEGRPGRKRLMALDIKKAFLYGDIEEDIYIELPDEDNMKQKGFVGKLIKAMYGTRSAPQIWQEVVRKKMLGLGFIPCCQFPGVYHHAGKDLKVLAHVDDFLCSGEVPALEWLKGELEKDFELKSEILGPDYGEVREVTFLGRRIKWTSEGLSYEGDPKHAEILIKEWNMEDAKAVCSPGTAEEKGSGANDEENQELDKTEATKYRRAAARVNYMALDRPDLGFAAKDLASGMAKPTGADVVRMKRTIRYLKGKPRAVVLYPWQTETDELTVLVDSDWAGCHKTRRSTSGGAIVYGRHVLAHWSSTQASVALSSGEAELNAIVKGLSEAIGVTNLIRSCGGRTRCTIRTDSSAANGIVHRRGCGKIKHLEAKQLWVQEKVMSKEVSIKKIPRQENPSDCLTHHWTSIDAMRHFMSLGLRWPVG